MVEHPYPELEDVLSLSCRNLESRRSSSWAQHWRAKSCQKKD